MIARLEQRTHGAESAIDDEMPEAEAPSITSVIVCHVCDEQFEFPRQRACGHRDCPHVQREAV